MWSRLIRTIPLIQTILVVAAALFAPRPAHGHGGLPVAQQLLWRGDSLLVPTPYWGMFVGSDGGPWRWICDEAINSYQQHTFAIGQDGTLYGTDRSGLQVYRDGGCTWDVVTGPLSALYVLNIVGDPKSPRAWALASGDGGGTSLWSSDDTGRTWTSRQDLPTAWPAGLYISEDGRTVVIGVMTAATPRQAQLIISRDGGTTFATETVFYLVAGQPLTQIVPMWVDPRAPADTYVAARADAVSVLLRIRSGAPPSEYLRLNISIFDMLRDAKSDQLLVATATGLYASSGTEPFLPLTTMSTSRCLSSHGGSLYACGWNFLPDYAAVARLEQGASQKSSIFQYQQTQGPIDCPADTPVGRICPMAWNIYADQLGIDVKKSQTPTAPAGCHMTGAAHTPSVPLPTLSALASLLVLYRRRTRRRPQACC